MESVQPNTVKSYLKDLQERLCETLREEDRLGHFEKDEWRHKEGGGGISRIFQGGEVFEKAGVNLSDVRGKALPPSATAARPELTDNGFRAMGVSTVIHPYNPFVPTAHANIRFFLAENREGKSIWWFGGGADLTPYYGFEEDAVHWHRVAQKACAPFGSDLYPRFKKNCDQYFYLKHRGEARGIGGLFFDDFNEGGFARSFAFIQSVGDSFIRGYQPLVARRKNTPYRVEHRQFQLYRRGRYVEFNLLYDRGTLFGLQSGGRAESILMSLPPLVRWEYNWKPAPGTAEARLYETFLKAQDWLSLPLKGERPQP